MTDTWEARFAEEREAREGRDLLTLIEMRLEQEGDFVTIKTMRPARAKAEDRLFWASNATEEAYS